MYVTDIYVGKGLAIVFQFSFFLHIFRVLGGRAFFNFCVLEWLYIFAAVLNSHYQPPCLTMVQRESEVRVLFSGRLLLHCCDFKVDICN